VNAPHWVQNSNNVSVALSVNYELRSVHRLTELHRFNRKLRRLGLSPAAPGSSPWREEVKLAAAKTLRTVVRAARKRRESEAPYPVWTPPAP
jgi:hypothetical protein